MQTFVKEMFGTLGRGDNNINVNEGKNNSDN